jgi:hypothetical protein
VDPSICQNSKYRSLYFTYIAFPKSVLKIVFYVLSCVVLYQKLLLFELFCIRSFQQSSNASDRITSHGTVIMFSREHFVFVSDMQSAVFCRGLYVISQQSCLTSISDALAEMRNQASPANYIEVRYMVSEL